MDKLKPCPCEKGRLCKMDEPCLGCEHYGEWLNKGAWNRIGQVSASTIQFIVEDLINHCIRCSGDICNPSAKQKLRDNFYKIVSGKLNQ